MQRLITVRALSEGGFVAECPSMPGCVGRGATESEARDRARQAIAACLAARAESRLSFLADVQRARGVG